MSVALRIGMAAKLSPYAPGTAKAIGRGGLAITQQIKLILINTNAYN